MSECSSHFSAFWQRSSIQNILCMLERSVYSIPVRWTCFVVQVCCDLKACIHQCSLCCKLVAKGSHSNTSEMATHAHYLWLLPKDKTRVVSHASWEAFLGSRHNCQLCFYSFPATLGSWSWNRAVGPGGHTAVTPEERMWLSCSCLYSPSPEKAKMWPLVPMSSWHLCLQAAQWWWLGQVCQDLLWGWAVSTVCEKMSAWLCLRSTLTFEAALTCP